MIKNISTELKDEIEFGKYSSWALTISNKRLEELFRAVCVFGTEYNLEKNMTGSFPVPRFAHNNMPESRMMHALEEIAVIQAGIGTEENFEEEPPLSVIKGSAFSAKYCEHLKRCDAFVSWAADLSENQLYLLLWQIDEYSSRVNLCIGMDGGEYPAPWFNVTLANENVMRDALAVIAAIYKKVCKYI